MLFLLSVNVLVLPFWTEFHDSIIFFIKDYSLFGRFLHKGRAGQQLYPLSESNVTFIKGEATPSIIHFPMTGGVGKKSGYAGFFRFTFFEIVVT